MKGIQRFDAGRVLLLAFGFCWLAVGPGFAGGALKPPPGSSQAAPSGEEDGLSPTESLMVQFIDSRNEQAVDLLRRVVNVNSGTMNQDGVREVGRLFRAELDALGFSTRWVDGQAFDRAGHLVAEREGTGPRLLLIGHLDTVFEPGSPFRNFEALGETEARGPGIIDMKGGDVIIVQALKALEAAGVLSGMNVTVIMTGDEEKPGRPLDLARRDLIEAARRADFAVGFEDGDMDPRTAVVARRGSTSWVVRVTARPAHSSQIFQEEVGYGAIFEAARILDSFRKRLAGEPLLTFNPGVVLGGTEVAHDPAQARGSAFGKENVIAEHAVVTGDLRCVSPQQLEGVMEVMRAVVADSLPHASSEIVFAEDGYPPMAPSDGNLRLLALYDRVSRDLGLGPVTAADPRAAGAADVSFTASHVRMAIDGLGLMGSGDHTVDETADLETLPSQTKRAAILLHRLSRGVQ